VYHAPGIRPNGPRICARKNGGGRHLAFKTTLSAAPALTIDVLRAPDHDTKAKMLSVSVKSTSTSPAAAKINVPRET